LSQQFSKEKREKRFKEVLIQISVSQERRKRERIKEKKGKKEKLCSRYLRGLLLTARTNFFFSFLL
jgi:phosphopantetheinyl transferase